MLFGSLAMLLSAAVSGHGLMSEPASRNWVCGAVTKPDTAEAGSACAEAFEGDFNGGYQFMSVLTHDVGRKGVSPLPTNVCGFDSETWDGGATPWDKPIDWPTQDMSPGETTITWDISWGPHFDDTEEFVYYITKPDFQYQVGEPLTWDDFESEPFCNLTGYDDTNPDATPNMNPDKGNSLFHTTCTIPERSGRHVIYGEWGRNYFTYERFHGCIDANFGGTPEPTVVANMTASPSDTLFVGSGEIAFDGSSSQGSNLSYEWSVEAASDSLYSLSSTSGSTTVLSLSEPQATSQVTVRLQVSSGSSSSSTSITFTHEPESGASWEDLGALTSEATTLSAGDEVQLRLVDDTGNDTYFPANALVIDGSNGAASSWPYELAQAVNDEADGAVRVGVLNNDGDVNPAQSATDNRVYAATPSNYSSAFVEIDEANASSSSSSSSSVCSEPSGSQCDWYGTLYPLCDNDDGWGWENNESCIGATTCSGQPDPYGIVGDGEGCPPASSSSSSQESSEESSSSSASSVGSGASCEHVIANDWGSGFTGSIEITNNGSSAINGWEVQWTYSGSTSVTNSWNAEVSGSNPYTATDMGWNGTIEPDETVSFGFQASGPAEQPEVTGAVCD